MAQELKLIDLHNRGKLNDDLLRVLTELLGLPALGVHRRVEQLGHWVVGVFAAAVNDLVVQLDRAGRHLRHFVCHP